MGMFRERDWMSEKTRPTRLGSASAQQSCMALSMEKGLVGSGMAALLSGKETEGRLDDRSDYYYCFFSLGSLLHSE